MMVHSGHDHTFGGDRLDMHILGPVFKLQSQQNPKDGLGKLAGPLCPESQCGQNELISLFYCYYEYGF